MSHIKPTSELGEFLQHHEPRPPAMPTSIPVAERRVECRIRATTRKRKTDPDVPSILLNSHNRGKRRRNAPPPGHPNATRAFAMSLRPQPTERLPPDPRGEEVTPPRVTRHPHPRDELDTLIDTAAQAYARTDNWHEFAESMRGARGDFHPNVGSISHPAASLMDTLRTVGAKADMRAPPWTKGRKKSALERGPHQSAKEHIEFLRQEFTDMINKGQWAMLPARMLNDEIELRLSPLGVVPQRDRRPRTICDYTYFQVNEDTRPTAPKEAMQFGKALQRILHHIHHANPHLGPVYLSKIDISDGFYRIWLRAEDIPKMAVLFPSRRGEEALVGLPLTLPMGWAESPPYFCSTTETVADLANAQLARNHKPPPHRLDELAESPVDDEAQTSSVLTDALPLPLTRKRHRHYRKPLGLWDAHVDDFVGLAQGNRWRRRDIKRVLLHELDRVFRAVDADDNRYRTEPASAKKMRKGDATWATRKLVLGWLIDTVQRTIELPPHRLERLRDILDTIQPGQKRVSTKQWHKVLGELRSMAIAIPGSRGLFSSLQEAFRHAEPTGNRLRLNKNVHDFLDDWRWIADSLSARPTRIAELVPSEPPDILGACDASGAGMGGVFFFVDAQAQPQAALWRARFPSKVQQRLVSIENPQGDITNSDLELAGSIAQQDVVAQHVDVRERTVHTLSDNTPTVHWQRKGSVTTLGPAAYLLRLQALHQRHHRYVSRYDYIPGVANVLADLCSRSWHLSDDELLSHFNSLFPQVNGWTLCNLRRPMLSALTTSLYRKRSDPESHQNVPQHTTTIGRDGPRSAPSTALIRSYRTVVTQFRTCKSSANATAMAALHPAVEQWQLELWRTPYERWDRSTPHWGPLTPEKIATERLTSVSPDSSEDMQKPTSRPDA